MKSVYINFNTYLKQFTPWTGERGGSVVECRTPEREVGGSKPTAAVLCPWARHLTPRKYWLITQEAVAPSRHDWKLLTGTLSLNTTKLLEHYKVTSRREMYR